MTELKKGFTYTVSREQIDEYTKWSLDCRLKWLFHANKMRKLLPQRQSKFKKPFAKQKSNPSSPISNRTNPLL